MNLQKEFEENNKETALDELSNRGSIKNEENMEGSQKKKGEENEKSKNFFQKWFVKSNKTENLKQEEKFNEIVKEKRKINDKINMEHIAKRFKNLVTLSDFSINSEFLKIFEKESNVFKNKV